MRFPTLTLTVLAFVIAAPAGSSQTRVTVAQLEQFLLSRQAQKASDTELADQLNSVTLTEQLSESSLRRILSRMAPGPLSLEILGLLAAASRLTEIPRADWIPDPAPPPADQEQMVKAAIDYAETTLRHLPDFTAIRHTRSFDNSPQSSREKHSKPKIRLHWTHQTQHPVTYRDGHELIEAAEQGSGPAPGQKDSSNAFNSWGEFGPILRIALSDSFKGSVAWSHWERNGNGSRIAVLRYTVPRAASHYSVDFCCYQEEEGEAWRRFVDKPGYHGDIYFDPASGTITGITLLADFDADSAMVDSGVAVEYGPVHIGANDYVCPLRSVTVSTVHNYALKRLDGLGLEKHINQVTFSDYHKFGSTARIVPVD